MAETADWELVYKRNSVERIKRDKPPLLIRDELPALVAQGYERMQEEDVVRLQWWGLYHDKPKIGTFMLRVKIPNGVLTPARLRAIGEVANRYGRGDAELTTRQCVQLHWLELASLADVFADLEAAGITSAGGCGDTVRNITGCPVSGIAADELFDSTPVVDAATAEFYGNQSWANLPRKHKYSIASCPDRCNAPEINCISLVGVVHEGREGYGVLVGGGLASVPRVARDLGVFVPKEESNEILGAITTVWSEDLKYRVSRVKARLKFMVDDIGVEGMLERVEAKLGRTLERFALPPIDAQPSAHVGVHAQKQDGLSYVGVPVPLGLTSGDQLIAVADLVEELGGDIRLTRQQNLIVTGVPDAHLDARPRRPRRAGPAARHERDLGQLDRLHGRAALQFLRRPDEGPTPRSRRPSRVDLRRRRRRPAPASRRLPARVRAALGRRPRLPGDDRQGRRREPPVRIRHPRARLARPRRADRDAALPPRAERTARRGGRRPRPRLARHPRRR